MTKTKNKAKFLITLLLVSCKLLSQKNETIINTFTQHTFEISHEIKLIPKEIKKAYFNRFNERLVLAAPGKPYNPTDLISDRYPRRRLIYLSTFPIAGMGFIFYEIGGIVKQNILMIYYYKPNIIFKNFLIEAEGLDYQNLVKYLIENKIYLIE